MALTRGEIFQSTLPRGERQYNLSIRQPHTDFNPRSHEGSDGEDSPELDKFAISIHAPTRGATYL